MIYKDPDLIREFEKCIDFQPHPFNSLEDFPYTDSFDIRVNVSTMTFESKKQGKIGYYLFALLPALTMLMIVGCIILTIPNGTKISFLPVWGITLTIMFPVTIYLLFILNNKSLSYSYKFNRINGLVTFCYYKGSKEEKEQFKFGEVKWLEYNQWIRWRPTIEIGLRVSPQLEESYHRPLFESNQIHAWSFLVWYMDRNRPLPPGQVFDQYRKEDYTRRKKQGFPKPLYKSKIVTIDIDDQVGLNRYTIG